MTAYNGTVIHPDGTQGTVSIDGDIVGPFGVATEADRRGLYLVTHLETGLVIGCMCSTVRSRAVLACHLVFSRVRVWQGKSAPEIAILNGMTKDSMKQTVQTMARAAGCEGMKE